MANKELKKLVVYYSLEGNTKMIAEAISKEIRSDILELKPKKDIEVNGPMRYLKGGKQVVTKEKPELTPYNINPEEYEVLFIGTPVWAWNFTPAIRTFFSKTNLSGKKIALFSCNGGQNGKTFENMKKHLEGNEFLGEIEFRDPLKNDTEKNIEVVKNWAKKIILSL
jgi:Flavodoxins